jgi:hypothetical protein
MYYKRTVFFFTFIMRYSQELESGESLVIGQVEVSTDMEGGKSTALQRTLNTCLHATDLVYNKHLFWQIGTLRFVEGTS